MGAVVRAVAAIVIVVSASCGRSEPKSGSPASLPVDVFADTGRSQRLAISAPRPRATVWLARVSPSPPSPLEPPLPVPSPESVESLPDPPRLEIDEGLKPPLLRHSGTLRVPRGTRRGSVELDVRVTEEGEVSDAMWAGGTRDSLLTAAAISCALEMRFFPALLAGRPIAVWCRQRFDFGAR
jgi:hypothetical protein